MALTPEQIVEETQQWPEEVVADLVDRILLAKYGGIAAEIDAAWRRETKRRLAEMESGLVKEVSLEESLAKARRILGREV
jgi:hypothetical protein